MRIVFSNFIPEGSLNPSQTHMYLNCTREKLLSYLNQSKENASVNVKVY